MSGHFYEKVSRKFPDSLFRPLPEQTKNPATFGGYGVCPGATDPIRTDDLLITREFPALNVLNRTFEKARNCAGWRLLPEQAEPLFSAFLGKKFPESFPQFPAQPVLFLLLPPIRDSKESAIAASALCSPCR